ncbi:coronin-1C-A-like isoform X4 [Physella acuta]|uniref:coronin-1C-A-like isoform X4 n=1 Tax=Physella acuta TaxID=109671 RepID=UPI0027DBBD23|nr:coronin-1C-A-like isoform X4 [Physella acuta]XP_059179239.1 coronin-1C-A-like isoform X4 [Physella acuta]
MLKYIQMAFMRKSKFRHVFGKPLKRDECYDGIRITRTSWESTYCAVNPKFVAIITEAAGGGSFLVLPLAKTGRVSIDHPMVAGHKGAVLDIAWCPHNDDVIASASEDCTVKLWQIPEDGLKESLTDPVVDLCAHQRRVTLLVWHPTAMNVLLSTGSDNFVILWNVGTGEAMLQVDMPDQIYSGSFNSDGSRFVCTCKDKLLRIMDTHTGKTISEGKCHLGSKPAQCAYLKNGQIFTTGFSKMSERQYALWDENDLNEPKTIEEIDSSNGVLFICYDADTSMVYLAGKGDSIIRYYEVTDEAPYVHFLTLYQSNSPQRGIGFMPKRGLNVNNNEIARFYKLHNNGFCEIIPFTVPRKSELFQDDLYPDTASDVPAISADDFFAGKNAEPVLVSLKDGSAPTKKEQLKVVRKSNILDKMPAKPQQQQQQQSSNNAEAAAAPSLPPGFDPQGILDDMRKLKLIVKAHERRIKTLEERLSQYESEEEAVEEA